MRTFGTFLLAGVAGVVAIALGEAAARVVRAPVDYLLAQPVPDPVLGLRIEPGDAGHDAWGFRNPQVPQTAESVAIGDSQTYGVSAAARDAWPAVLGRSVAGRVYNLSLGGYGPVQYLALFESRALALSPAVVLVGLYFGNDLLDAYRAAYGLDAWSRLRSAGMPAEVIDWIPRSERNVVLGGTRDWLARHSVLYRMFTFSALGVSALRIRAIGEQPDGALSVRVPGSGATTVLVPETRLAALDAERREVQEGLRITLAVLGEMNALARQRGVRLGVVLIPTKERVFAEAGAQPRNEVLERLLRAEAHAGQHVAAFLAQERIPYVDALAPLREELIRRAVYRPSTDGHPERAGYAVIAAAARSLVASEDAPADARSSGRER